MEPYQQLIAHLQHLGPLAVAFSGGVDSTLLLQAAHAAGGDRVLAFTAQGPMHFQNELADARGLADRIGVPFQELHISWDELPELAMNPSDRCYLCKRVILTRCLAELPPGYQLCEGSTSDDLHAHRPGRRAVMELGVRSPLLEVGLGKADIRSISRQLKLPTWDKPAQSCLLTRFPHHAALSPADLKRVETCEEALHRRGFRIVRVRSLGKLARLEFGSEELAKAQSPAMKETITALCQQAGFSELEIDPAGYRSGSMD